MKVSKSNLECEVVASIGRLSNTKLQRHTVIPIGSLESPRHLFSLSKITFIDDDHSSAILSFINKNHFPARKMKSLSHWLESYKKLGDFQIPA
jgi:hypothetical protein